MNSTYWKPIIYEEQGCIWPPGGIKGGISPGGGGGVR